MVQATFLRCLIIVGAIGLMALSGCSTGTQSGAVTEATNEAATEEAAEAKSTSRQEEGGIPLREETVKKESLGETQEAGSERVVQALDPEAFPKDSPKTPAQVGHGPSGILDPATGLQHVLFDYDQYQIRSDAGVVLQEDAKLLMSSKYQDSKILIQGHCDFRGTTKYNLVLGERRAQAVKRYLVDLGVTEGRMNVISYGEEKPFCTGQSVACLQQNRRGHFVLQ